MSLWWKRYPVGILETTAYLVADPKRREAVLIDPGGDGAMLAQEVLRRGWRLVGIWITHAHFDHFAGLSEVLAHLPEPPAIALHPADKPLWAVQGGAAWFGLDLPPQPEPDTDLTHGQRLMVGRFAFEVRHAPGHSPGHVMFYQPEAGLLFCGDVIFYMGIGRTDLPFGDYAALEQSIRTQVYTLPDSTRLLPGHGPETTVEQEKRFNPFIPGEAR